MCWGKRGGDGSRGTARSREKESTSGGGDLVERLGVRAGSMMVRRGSARGVRQQRKHVGVHGVGVGKRRRRGRRAALGAASTFADEAGAVAESGIAGSGRQGCKADMGEYGGAARGPRGGAVLLGGVSTVRDGSVGAVCGGGRMPAAGVASTRGRSGKRAAGGEKWFVAGVASDERMLVRCYRAV